MKRRNSLSFFLLGCQIMDVYAKSSSPQQQQQHFQTKWILIPVSFILICLEILLFIKNSREQKTISFDVYQKQQQLSEVVEEGQSNSQFEDIMAAIPGEGEQGNKEDVSPVIKAIAESEQTPRKRRKRKVDRLSDRSRNINNGEVDGGADE